MADARQVFERAFGGYAFDELLRERGQAAFRHGCHVAVHWVLVVVTRMYRRQLVQPLESVLGARQT